MAETPSAFRRRVNTKSCETVAAGNTTAGTQPITLRRSLNVEGSSAVIAAPP